MDFQNLAYALTQVVHNFGAVTVVAGPLYAVITNRPTRERCLLWVVLAGWGAQLVSGMLFGLVSFYYYSQLPDLHGIAIAALSVKVVCAMTAVLITAVTLRYRARCDKCAVWLWPVLAVLGVIALTAAAFLRWFS